MFAFIFLSGLLTFGIWDWWVLQRAIFSSLKCRHPWCVRLALLVAILAIFLVPGFLLRHAAIASPAWQRIMMWCFTLEVIGLWFGVMAFLLMLWNFFAKNRLRLSPGKIAWVALGVAIVSAVVGYFQAMYPRVKHYDIALATVPPEADGYQILLLSDLHITQFYPESILNAVDKAVQENHPDLILHVGDFIDKPYHGAIEHIISERVQWQAPDGFYAVFGNHDGYVGWEESLAFHNLTPMKVLGEHTGTERAYPREWLCLTGVDDPVIYTRPHAVSTDSPDGERYMNRIEAYDYVRRHLPSAEPGFCNIFLCHQPGFAPSLPEGYDLMLSGHTHGGQIFPFNFVANMTNKFRASIWHSFRTGLRLYICRGTGFWGPPLRFLAPAEITVITLHPQSVEAEK